MTKTSSKPKSDYAIRTVANALRMLEAFQSETELGVSDLARRLGLHKNNVFRLLATLELAGYIQQSSATDLYRLGPACLELGRAYASKHSLMREARPLLEELARRSGETAHLGILQEDEVVHLDAELPDQLVLVGSRVGLRLPTHCTAIGKALLSARVARPTGEVDAAEVGDPHPLCAHTDATIVDREKLVEELRTVQLRGYAVDLGEYARGLCCVAAPIRDDRSRVVGALSLSGPGLRLDEERLHGEAAGLVVDAATRLSVELGSVA